MGLLNSLSTLAGGIVGGVIQGEYAKGQGERNFEYSKKLQQMQHEQQLESMKKSNDYQRQFAQDQYSLMVKGMQEAGLNPFVGEGPQTAGNEALQAAGGTGNGQMETGGNPGEAIGTAISNAAKTASETNLIDAQVKKTEAETENLGKKSDLTDQQILNLQKQCEKLTAEIENVRAGTSKLKQEEQKIIKETTKTAREIMNVDSDTELKNTLQELTEAQIETELSKPDLIDAQTREALAKEWDLTAGDLNRELGNDPTFGDWINVLIKKGGAFASEIAPIAIGIAASKGTKEAMNYLRSVTGMMNDKIDDIWRENSERGIREQFKYPKR